MKRLFVGIVVLAIVATFVLSCKTAVRVTPNSSAPETKFSKHDKRVFITRDTLPASMYISIAKIETQKKTYGSNAEIYVILADKAREVGADAVIEVVAGQKVSAWAWATPYGYGKAVKILDNVSIDYSKVRGEWY